MADELDLYHRTSREAARSILAAGSMTSRENTGEAFFSNRAEGQGEGYGQAVVHVRVPVQLAELEDEFPDGEQHFRVHVQDLRVEHFVDAFVPATGERLGEVDRPKTDADRPWTVGDQHARWEGYLDPQTGILRNLLGATTAVELRVAEDDLVEARALELLEHPVPQTFDLAHMQALHRHLFQDVYPWAGQLRTVDMSGGDGPSFLPHDQVPELIEHVAGVLRDADWMRSMSLGQVKESLPLLYNIVNTAHPFREGNGRTQRQFFHDLTEQAGLRIDWTRVQGRANDLASEAARQGDLEPMHQMFGRIITEAPDRDVRQARQIAGASFPDQRSSARGHVRAVPSRHGAAVYRTRKADGPELGG